MGPIVVVDTGFVLSVAAVDQLPVVLANRWKDRATWPHEVQSELAYRDRRPGGGIPAGLARRALNSAHLWLPAPVKLSDEQQDRAVVITERLGGGDGRHAGEAAGAVLAADGGGVLATEDYAAANVLRRQFGVTFTCVCSVLQRLHADGAYTRADLATALRQLEDKGRPNVDGLSEDDLISGAVA